MTWSMRIGKIDRKAVAALGDGGADVDVLRAVAVVIDDGLAVVDAIFPFADHRARLAFGAVEHRFDRGERRGPAELGGQRQQPAFADVRRADHRREVAAKIVRVADVGHQHFEHIAPHLAAVVEPQRRDANPFLPDFRGGGVVGAVRGAADVALVRAVDRPEQRLFPGEYRHKGGEVG